MVNGRPAMVRVALCAIFVGFAATVKFTEPAPDPPLPETMLTHDGTPVTIHGQLGRVVTLTDPEPPVDEKAWLAKASEYVQTGELMVIERFCAAEITPRLSRTDTPKFKLPAKEGIPLTTPVAAFRFSPGGSAPLTTVQ